MSDHVGAHGGHRPPLRQVDETSALVLAEASATLVELEAALALRGLTLGPIPVESLQRTLGAALASPRPSEATPHGRLIDRCAALEAVLPDGTAIETRLAPRKASGPDFAAALIGARGATGRITGAWLRVRRRAPLTLYAGWLLEDGGAALDGARRLLARGAVPSELALMDRALGGGLPGTDTLGGGLSGTGAPGHASASTGTLVLLRLEGASELVHGELALATELFGAAGGASAPSVPMAARLVEELLVRRSPLRLAERFVPSEQLVAAWRARKSPAALLGLRHAGAAFCSAAMASLPAVEAPSPMVGALHAALQQALVPAVAASTGAGPGAAGSDHHGHDGPEGH